MWFLVFLHPATKRFSPIKRINPSKHVQSETERFSGQSKQTILFFEINVWLTITEHNCVQSKLVRSDVQYVRGNSNYITYVLCLKYELSLLLKLWWMFDSQCLLLGSKGDSWHVWGLVLSPRPSLHQVLKCVLIDQITSRRGRYIPVYTWCFNPSFLSTFNHFCPDFFEGRVYGQENVWSNGHYLQLTF